MAQLHHPDKEYGLLINCSSQVTLVRPNKLIKKERLDVNFTQIFQINNELVVTF